MTTPDNALIEHKPGCDALGGYGHGKGACICGVDPKPDALQRAGLTAIRLAREGDTKAAEVIRAQADHIASLEAERDEADRRAGAAEREMQTLKDTIARLNSVRSKQKRDWGVDDNTSFDVIWNEALALKAQLSQAKKELTTQTNRAAAAEQQVTALTQRLDTANALNKEARNQLAQLSQVQAVPSDPLLSLEANAHEIFNNPPSETRQEVRDVIEWYAASVRVALAFPTSPPARKECWCETCRPVTLSDMRFVVCPDCGNKRCPKANNHDNACTSSNAPGQPGSSWEHVKPHGIGATNAD